VNRTSCLLQREQQPEFRQRLLLRRFNLSQCTRTFDNFAEALFGLTVCRQEHAKGGLNVDRILNDALTEDKVEPFQQRPYAQLGCVTRIPTAQQLVGLKKHLSSECRRHRASELSVA
jgi:hypothetical protein